MIKRLILIWALLFLLVSLSGCGVKTVPEGTTLEGIDVSGLNYEELQVEKEALLEKWNGREMELHLEEESKTVKSQELGIRFYFDDDKIMEEAGEYYLQVEVCEDTAKEKIEALFPLVLEEPVNAELVVEQEPVITEHQEGRQVALDEIGPLIEEKAWEDQIELPVEPLLPDVTTQNIKDKGIVEVVSRFKTEFNAADRNRSGNIALAAESIDHTVLAPGEVFSFNNTAGPYSADRGFQSAPVYRQGTVTTGLGGGVCQASSTVYNAALLSGAEIVERHPHSLPVWYVPLARDAAVSFGGGDLRFKNSLENHLYIRMHVDRERGTIEATFWGTKEKEISVGSEIEERISAPVKEEKVEDLKEKEVVEKGQDGYQAHSWRIVDGEWEFVSRDRYQPLERVVKLPLEEEKEDKKEEEKEKEEKPEEKPEEPAEEENDRKPGEETENEGETPEEQQ